MKNAILALTILLVLNLPLEAGPSSIFWTNCTTEIYQAGVSHLDADTYFDVYSRKNDPSVPSDTGLETGIFEWQGIKAEAGFDFSGGGDHPLTLNAGIAIGEGHIFKASPSLKLGIFNCGTHTKGKERNNQNIVDVIVGFSLPAAVGGEFYFGGFTGSSAMGKNRQGFMAAYKKYFCQATDCSGTQYCKWLFCADYASGKNTIGGGGVAVGYHFTPHISLITGPIWFNSAAINGRWKWSAQLGINFSIFDCVIGNRI